MPANPGSPSLLRRFGPVALFQRARNLLLRPVRHELADARKEIDGLRHELAALREALVAGEQRNRDLVLRGVDAQVSAAFAAHHEQLVQAQAAQASQSARMALLETLLVGSLESDAALPPGLDPPLVSIVMPVRDRADCVAEAIASVQAQRYPHWELLVVDDGSSDDTAAVARRFLGDQRIRLESIAHTGPSGARNHGLQMANGELVAYLDSDNTWFPGFLSAAVAAFVDDPALQLAYGALASEAHAPGELRLLLEQFDRSRLEAANYIDLNTVVHRHALFEARGGFDESLARAIDWELLLRYSAHGGVRALPVLAARYRVLDRQRITDTVPIGPSWISIRKRIDPVPAPPRRPRVLYVVWHYPQLSETYLEGEIRCLRRWGVDIAVWREVPPVSPYEPVVPVHDGDLAALVREFRPDVVHVHWLGFALNQEARLAALGVPVTLRMHGFDVTPAQFRKLLGTGWLHRVYAFPAQLALLDAPDARVRAVPSAFDTSYFQPAARKDTKLVLRSGSCLPSKDIGLFFELAKRLPSHRFVFCGVTCNEFEHFPEELRQLAARMGSPAELRFDVPREQMAELMANAGIYLHTINPPDAPFGAPIGMPISIAEAMATGAYVLVRNQPELVDYVGDAGAAYADADEAARIMGATTHWSDDEWRLRGVRASDRGFLRHADELVLRPILEDWQQLARSHDAVEAAIAGVVA